MSIGIWQLILVLAIVLILFGAGKLPKVMGDLGRGMKSFKQGLKEEEEKEKEKKAGEDGAKTIQHPEDKNT